MKLNWRYMILRGKLGAVLFILDSQPDDIQESQALDALLDTFLLDPDRIPVFNKRTGESTFDDETVVWYQRGFLAGFQTLLLQIKEEMHPDPARWLQRSRFQLMGTLEAYRWYADAEPDCATLRIEREKRETAVAEGVINGQVTSQHAHPRRLDAEGYIQGLLDIEALVCAGLPPD
jgi:hypothetical protein